MHHLPPSGAWTVDALPSLEVKRSDGSSICEAGCYQCLLSYFNQPDHEHINRRDPDALGCWWPGQRPGGAPNRAPLPGARRCLRLLGGLATCNANGLLPC
jgi:hypothetical protein